jgi:hypothetical protein
LIWFSSSKFRAPSKYEQEESKGEGFDEEELEEVLSQLALQSQQVIFDKPS